MRLMVLTIVTILFFLPAMGQNKAKVYLDVSKSMQAYMSSEENNSFQATLLHIKGILTGSGYTEFELNTIGKNINKQNSFNNIERYSMIREAGRFYNAAETNLVGVLADVIKSGSDINILITDGVLSKNSPKGSETKSTDGGDCSTGYDIGCFMKRFSDILDENYVVHVIGITSHFVGSYYSEILKIKRGRGYTIIENKGINRPFYLFILGKKLSKTMSFVNGYLNWFDSFYNPGERGLEIKSIRISPIALPVVKVSSAIPKYLYDNKKTGVFTLKGKGSSYMMINKIKGSFLKLSIPIKIVYTKTPGFNFSKYIKIRERYKLDPSAGKSKFVFKKRKSDSGDIVNYDFYFSKGLIRSFRKLINLRYSFWAEADLSKLQVWNDWSTLDDGIKENLGKTLNISPLLTYLIKNSIRRLNITENCRIDNSISFSK